MSEDQSGAAVATEAVHATPRRRLELEAARAAAAAVDEVEVVQSARTRASAAAEGGGWRVLHRAVCSPSTESIGAVHVCTFESLGDPRVFRVEAVSCDGERRAITVTVAESMLPTDEALRGALASTLSGGLQVGESDGSVQLSMDSSILATWVTE
jgi:hypothetical protein